MKNKIMNLAVAMLSVAFLQTGCSEEDFPQPQQSGAAGTLHIASISIDGQQVKSRAVADDGNQYDFNEYAYNQSLNSFAAGDRVGLQYRFTTGPELHPVDAVYRNGQWTIVGGSDVSVWLRPDPTAEAEKWENIYLSAEIKGSHLSGEEALALADDLDFVAGDISDEDVCLMSDALIATSNADEQSTKNYGAITIDNDITSPNLGAMTIELKHVGALLRLSKEAVEVEEGTYIVDGSQYNATGLATLWAALYDGLSTRYYPLTEVGENLQAILQVGTSGDRKLTGFKAVMKTDRENQYFTLDLPFTVETQASVSDGMALQSNYCYPLTLNISPNRSSVTLSGDGLGKPGWGEDEDETTLDNGLNDLAAKAKTELSYTVSTSTFSVSGPNGLMLLNKWMTEGISTEALKSVAFEGANDIPADVNPMAQNITFTEEIILPAPKDGESNWTPVGNADKPYTGTIDGAGKTLTGMVINSTDKWQGFVGILGEGGKVQNLTFNDAQVTGEWNTAIVVGRMLKNSTVENCHTTGTSSVKSTTMDLGGLVGYNSTGIITRCSNAAQVEGPAAIGGIVGTNLGIVSACTNSGAVSADVAAGGMVGANYGDLIACGNTGMVSGDMRVGGIVGENTKNGTVTASWTQDTNEKDSEDNAPALGTENGVGLENGGSITSCHVFSQASSVTAEHITTMNIAIAAWNATDGNIAVAYGWKAATSGQWPSLALITELSDSWPVKVEDLYKVGTDLYTADGVKLESHGVLITDGTDYYTAAGKKLESHGVLFTDGTDYYTAAGVKVEGFALADGTATVSTANALLLWNAMAQTDLDLNLTLTDNITLPQPAEGGSNWTPVGNISTPYTGTINGGGHTLTGMVINSTEGKQGFVGYLGSAGKVQNITFVDATVISSSGYEVGIVAGYNEGTVENCHTTDDSSVEGFEIVGGIVGSNWGLVSACINSSAVRATVEKDPFHMEDMFHATGGGGIVGDNYRDVIACGNTGTINGKYSSGGIVGRHGGGSVIASWTQDTNETDNDGNAPSTENGVGYEESKNIIHCYVFSETSPVTTALISTMNTYIETYNGTASVKCLYRWEPATGGYPTLKTVTE